MADVAPAQGGNPDAGTRNRPSRRRVLIVLGIVAAVAAWGVRWWTVGHFIETTDDAYLQADSVTIAPKVSDYITDVLVGDNQTVAAGAPLAKLDTRQYQASLDQARATLDARAADIQRAQANLKQQEANAEQAKAQAEVSHVSLKHAEDDVERYRPLAATGATEAQIAQAKAQLEAAQAQLDQSKLDLNDTTLYSPLAGCVGDRTVRVGQYVQPGTRLMTVVPVQSVYLTANFKETQVGRMRVGQQATLHVDALKGTDLHGVVDSFAPGTGAQFALLPPENATGNFTKIVQRVPVRIRIDTGPNTRKVLLPGLSVTVDVDTQSATDDSDRIAAENHHG